MTLSVCICTSVSHRCCHVLDISPVEVLWNSKFNSSTPHPPAIPSLKQLPSQLHPHTIYPGKPSHVEYCVRYDTRESGNEMDSENKWEAVYLLPLHITLLLPHHIQLL